MSKKLTHLFVMPEQTRYLLCTSVHHLPYLEDQFLILFFMRLCMSDALSALFQKLLDVIDALKGPCFVILSVLGILYVYHDNPFGIYTLLNRYADLPAILFFIWLAAGVLCLFSIGKWLQKNIQNAFEQRADTKQNQEKLHHLTEEQKHVIINLLQTDQTYHYFQPTDLMEVLEYDDIVRATGIPEPSYNGQYVPTWAPRLYILQSWVRDYLRKYPDLLQLAKAQQKRHP